MSVTQTEIEIVDLADMFPYEDDGDENRKAHAVRPTENKHIINNDTCTGQDIVDTARMLGLEVVAACGYKWVPTHDPRDKKACDPCMKIVAEVWGSEG
jgi:hypothetical protein